MTATHRQTLADLAVLHAWRRGAELGLGHGHLFRLLLDRCPSLEYLVGVDLCRHGDRRETLRAIAAAYPDRARLLEGSTHDIKAQIPNGSLDFVFVDAGHSYNAVRQDLADWWPKVRPGGWFGGHDYHERYPGVVRAVDERFGSARQLAPGWIWWVTR